MKKQGMVLGFLLLFSGCGGDDESPNTAGITATDPCSRASTLSEQPAGSCQIHLLFPSPCEEIDLTNDQAYEFRWTTGGTSCPGPGGRFTGFKIHFAGQPVTQNDDGTVTNLGFLQLPAGGDITRGGGKARIRARDLKDTRGQPLTSSDGTYDWTVRSGLEAGPASVVFRVRR
jgi:hypothetical protein